MLGLSDAGAHASQLCDACFSTHLLGHWVREKGVLSLEKAVRMLTSRPAEVFGIADRGRLAVGLRRRRRGLRSRDGRQRARCAACAICRQAPTAWCPTLLESRP